jgi:glycosyltransferase involved in cell wall biosynthesis
MRIAYILNTLATGGAERQVAGLADRMIARGHSVKIIALRSPAARELSPSVPVDHLEITRNPLALTRGLIRGISALRSFHPDLIHSNNFHGNMAARALRLFLPRTRLVSTIHNVYEGSAMRMLSLRLTDPLSDHTVAVSRAAADQAVLVRPVPLRKCSVIANGIDCAEFAPIAERRARIRAKAGVSIEFIWLAVGRLVPAKDYPSLLRAFAVVHAALPEARLWIAGEGNQQYTGHLRALSLQPGMIDGVRWLGLRSDMPALLDAADGFVLASTREGMPLALGEAMAMEKVIVATDVGGVRELAGDCAALVAAGDPALLARAMLRQMRVTPKTRKARGRAARKRIVEKFSIERTAAEWEALYLRLLSGHSSSR